MSAAAPAPRPELAALQIADEPGRWAALGFTVTDATVTIGGVAVSLGGPGRGITGWTLRHVGDLTELDGLPTSVTTEPAPPAVSHRNGAIGIDQVVVATPDFTRTAEVLDAAGMPLRRVRDAGGFRQGFRRLGPAILELVETRDGAAGPAKFWGLVVIVSDLEVLQQELTPYVGEIRDAVQPGRQIANLDREAGLSLRVAFMDPE